MSQRINSLRLPLRLDITAICSAMLLAVSASPLFAQTVNCDAPGQNLQSRIDATSIGDRLDVMGVCDEGPYIIRKDMKLVGPATLSATSGSVLTISGAKAELRDLTIIADDASDGLVVIFHGSVTANNIVVSGAPSEGILVLYSSFLGINSSTVKDSRVGVNVANGSSMRMFDTTVEHNTLHGINVSRASAGAIFSSRINHNAQFGIYVLWDASLQMNGTEITNNGIRGLNIFLQSFVNFFDPPSTIEFNGFTDVSCEGRSGFFATSTQISLTKVLLESADCLDSFGAPIF